MSRVQKLRVFVSQRLNAAVEEIFSVFEKTILKLEEEAALSQEVIARQHALLCTLNKPLMDLPTADAFTQQLIGNNEAAHPVQQQQQQKQKNQEVEEVEVELQDLDEAEIIKFTYNRRCVAKPPKPAALSAAKAPQEGTGTADSNQDVLHVLSSETEDSDDYSKDPEPPSKKLKPKTSSKPGGRLSCRVCNQNFRLRRVLFRHVKSHLQEAEQVCGVCGERFESASGLMLHIQSHWTTRGRDPENNKTQNQKNNKERQLHQRSNHNTNSNVHEDQKPDGKKRKRGRPKKKDQKPEGNKRKTT